MFLNFWALISDGRNSLTLLLTVLILAKIKGGDSGYTYWWAHLQLKVYIFTLIEHMVLDTLDSLIFYWDLKEIHLFKNRQK